MTIKVTGRDNLQKTGEFTVSGTLVVEINHPNINPDIKIRAKIVDADGRDGAVGRAITRAIDTLEQMTKELREELGKTQP